MQIVIDIPKELYDYMQSETYDKHLDRRFDYRIRFAVKDGIPLPKGHGRLIDAEKLAREINRAWTLWEKKGEDCYLFSDVLTPMLVSQQTIIETDEYTKD